MSIPDEDRICENCRNRDYANAVWAPLQRPYGRRMEELCPCLKDAVQAEGGPCAVLFAADGHCRFEGDAFEPSDKFLDSLCVADHSDEAMGWY